MTALGIILIVYAIFVLVIAFMKPAPIWNLKKIQGFVSALTETGTVIFFVIWGLAALALGVWLLVK